MRFFNAFLLVFIFCNTSILAQTSDLDSCVSKHYSYSDFQDKKNDSLEYNLLIDQVCEQIQSKSFEKALETLDAILALTKKYDGEPNVYFESRRRRLQQCFEDHNGGTVQNDLKEEVVNDKVLPDAEAKQKAVNEESSRLAKGVDSKGEALVQAQTVEKADIQATQQNALIDAEANSKPDVELTAKSDADEKSKMEDSDANLDDNPVLENKVITSQDNGLINNTEPNKDSTNQSVQDSSTDDSSIYNETVSFSEEQQSAFKDKGMQKVKQFEEYLYQIGSKSTPSSISSLAIDDALKLFDREDRTIQVSSVRSPEKPKFKVKIYLQRVKNLNYEQVDVEWADFQYASEFIKAPDGNYHGYVVFSQRFTGKKDGKIIYQDITTKRQQIILKYYEKALQGAMVPDWEVFLGDMSVEMTSEN